MRPVGIRETLCQAIAKLVMRATGDQVKTACESLQLCAGLEAGIEGATHAVAQRRREQHAMEPRGGTDDWSEGAEDESLAAPRGAVRAGEAARVGGIGEVPQPPGERSSVEEGERGEGGASDELRTAMAGMEEEGEEMNEGGGVKVDQEIAEEEEGGSEDALLALESTGLLTQDE